MKVYECLIITWNSRNFYPLKNFKQLIYKKFKKTIPFVVTVFQNI